MVQKKSAVRVYLAGGCSANIGVSLFTGKNAQDTADGFADIKVAFIDTSKSNFDPSIEADFYRIEGTVEDPIDGSGMIRRTNYIPIKAAVPSILHTYKPENLNIIVHSAAGGSGSVIGSVLVSELLDRGENVAVIMIGSTKSATEVKNTIDTIHSYQSISEKRNKSVVAIYLENSRESPMAVNDAIVKLNTLFLASVWSGENKGLDSQDLDHFLNYNLVTKFPPGLTGLQICSDGSVLELGKGQAVSSVVTLVRDGEDPDPEMMVGYHSFGVMSPAASDAVKVASPIHLYTIQGYFTDIVSALQSKMAQADEQYRVNPVRALNMANIQAEDDGVVL